MRPVIGRQSMFGSALLAKLQFANVLASASRNLPDDVVCAGAAMIGGAQADRTLASIRLLAMNPLGDRLFAVSGHADTLLRACELHREWNFHSGNGFALEVNHRYMGCRSKMSDSENRSVLTGAGGSIDSTDAAPAIQKSPRKRAPKTPGFSPVINASGMAVTLEMNSSMKGGFGNV